MGRTLEAFKKPDIQENEEPGEAPVAAPDTPQLQLVAEEDPADEMPYIEIGGRGKVTEASPGVLAASQTAPLRPGLETGPHRGLALADCGPRTIAFQPSRRVHAPPVPCMPAEVIAFHQPDHPVSQQYRGLLEQIVPEAPEGPGRVLLFTALSAAAGVTTALLNLAVCASGTEGRQVMVVDANLERPALASRLGLAEAPGLHEALAGSAALEQVVRATAREHLYAVTAGKGPRLSQSSGAHALTVEAVRWVSAWLRQRFDLIFLDGLAWEEAPETAALVGAADGVLLVLDHGDVNRPQIRGATRAIARMGGRLGGLLVTQ
jgi:Mrp family chromosome partitioning ATPase